MKTFLIIFLVLIQFGDVYANDVERRRKNILSVINDELKDVSRLNKRTKGRDPELLLRKAELYLEKARLLKEKESARYLSLSVGKRKRINKAKFFKKSRGYMRAANKICYRILKQHKRFARKGEVYYILAYNAKEFNQKKKALRLFRRVLKSSPKSSSIYRKSQLAAAEIYFSYKNYRRAIPLYERSLRRSKKSKWYTKDMYNLAWSYFRTRRHDEAIRTMMKVYKYSQKSSYVNMSEYAVKDLAYFYADANRLDEAEAFYKEINRDLRSTLMSVAKRFQNKGRHVSARKILKVAGKHSKNDAEKVGVTLQLLESHKKSRNTKKHLSVSKKAVAFYERGQLNQEQKEALLYHLKYMATILQKSAVGKAARGSKKLRNRQANYSVEYYTLLGKMDKATAYKGQFYAAEVLYGVGRFNEAVKRYVASYRQASSAGNEKFKKLALDGAISSLGKKGISADTKKKYLTFGYMAYLKDNPRGAKSNKIYQRIFKDSIKQKQIAQAEGIFSSYLRNYPNQRNTQEAMLGQIMDFYRKKKDRAGILKWVNRINSGEIAVSKKYAKSLKNVLFELQFSEVSKAQSVGDKKKALSLYLQFYKDKDSSVRQKVTASYNIAALLQGLGRGDLMYLWGVRALEIMPPKEIKDKIPTFTLMADTLFGLRMLKRGAKLNLAVFNKICNINSGAKTKFFRNSILLNLAEKKVEEAKRILDSGAGCGVSKEDIRKMQLNVLRYYYENKMWPETDSLVAQLSKNPRNYGDLIVPLNKLRIAYGKHGRVEESQKVAQKIIQYYKDSKAKNRPIPLEGLDVVAMYYSSKLKKEAGRLGDVTLTFPEDKFSKLLKQKFAILESIQAKANDLVKTGSGRGAIRGFRILVDSYKRVVNEIKGFTPVGKSPEYMKSFRKSMEAVTNQLEKKAATFSRKARSLIVGQTVLTLDNHGFLSSHETIARHYPPEGGIPMDKGGRQ